MKDLNKEFWSSRYKDGTTGWDIGHVSTPIKEYLDQLEDRSIAILIPGAGRSYEAEYCLKSGFTNTNVIDIAPEPIKALKERVPEFPEDQLFEEDFFTHEGKYDLILEQTFFCALEPGMRNEYVRKMHSLLNKGGKLSGVMFQFPLSTEGPPFGGSKEEYKQRFEYYFTIRHLSDCYNSIEPRSGKEVFVCFERKELNEKD